MGCSRPASSRSAAISRFSRSCEPPTVSAASRAADESFSRRRHQLGVPARRERANETRQAAELLVLLQALERFEHRQVGFAAGEPFGAAAAADADRFAALLELADERLDESRLADAGLSRHDHQARLAAMGALELVIELGQLVVAPDDAGTCREPARGDGHRRQRRCDVRVVRERQPVHHLARALAAAADPSAAIRGSADRARAAARG